MYLACECLAMGEIGPMKSMTHFSNGCSSLTVWSGSSSQCDWFPILWQTSNFFTNVLLSLCTISHHNPACSIFIAVGFAPTWLPATPLWHSHKISSLSWSMTHLHKTWSNPILYNCPTISWYSISFTTKCLPWVAMYSVGHCLVVRYIVIYSR